MLHPQNLDLNQRLPESFMVVAGEVVLQLRMILHPSGRGQWQDISNLDADAKEVIIILSIPSSLMMILPS
jgi:hypothetical protein